MNSPIKNVRLALTILLVAYWLAMFIGTHIPLDTQALKLPGSDKSWHLAAYAGLAFLIAFRYSFGKSLGWKQAATVMGVAALYGVFDELSQIPVGRHADILDWFADIAGAVGGLALVAALKSVLERYTESGRSQP